MEKKKVMFFIYQMGAGGAARTFLNLLNHIDSKAFTPILVTLNFEGNYEKELHPNIRFIKLKTNRLRKAILPLAKLIRKERPDVLFSTIPVYNTVAILAKTLSLTNTKVIVREAAYLGGTFRENMSLRIFGLLYRTAHKVISLSEGVKDNLMDKYKVKGENIEVIYNPIDLDKIRRDAKSGFTNQGHQTIFQNSPLTIVTAGRLVPEKDHQTLLKAFQKIRQQKEATLIILGEGELKNTLKEKAKELGISDHVYLIGFQENPYVYFKHADLFVLSSIHEGFGHVLVESLAVGTPVVSTDCWPGAREVLKNGKYGQIAEVGNAKDLANHVLDHLSLSAEEKEAIIENGKRRAEDFHAKKIVKQYEDVFKRVINGE